MLDPRALARFRKNKGALFGVALVALILGVSLLGPWISPHSPAEQFAHGLTDEGLPKAPFGEFMLGTDSLGRDELSRLLHGAAVSMQVAFLATALSSALGLLVGVVTGYFGGRIDQFGMRFVDVLLSMPFLLIAIAVNRAIASPSLFSLYCLLGGLSWASLARITRAKVLQVRELDYVAAAQALGVSTSQILRRHVLPNVVGPALAIGTTMVADMIIAESAMSFLGLGVQPPTASWGSMLFEGQDAVGSAPHLVFVPSFMIALTVFGFNLLGEGLRDALDPKA